MGVFNDTLKEYGLGSGEKLKITDGANRMRILSKPLMVQSTFKGTLNTKFVCWVIDRKDSVIKLYYMPRAVLKFVSDFEVSEDYGFNSLPMPYDITVNATKAGTIDAEYSVLPGKESPLTQTEVAEFAAKKPIEEVVTKLLENQNVTEVSTGDGESRVKTEEDVPLPQEPPTMPPRYNNIPQEFRPR